jgi:predicted small lipoprotein YifL
VAAIAELGSLSRREAPMLKQRAHVNALPLTFELLFVCAWALAGCGDKGAGNPSPAAVAVANQDDALQQAKNADLPALKVADRALVSEVAPPIGTAISVEITNADQVSRLLDALMPTKVPPSSGKEAMTVHFYQGPTLLREVWVFQDGEWGFRRPGTSWTIGRSDELVRLIRQELAAHSAAR